MRLRPIDIRRIAGEAGAAERNARRWAHGEDVSDNLAARCEAAAQRLGYPVAAPTRPATAPIDVRPSVAASEPNGGRR